MFLFKRCTCWTHEERNQLNRSHFFRPHTHSRYTCCDRCGLSLDGQELQCIICPYKVHMKCEGNVTTDCIEHTNLRSENFDGENIFSVGPSKFHQREKKLGINDYNLLKVIGKGSFGKVMLAERKGKNELFAIKVLRKSESIPDYVMTEKNVLKLATQHSHPFLTALHSCFQTPGQLFFVMEYISGGSLWFHFQEDGKFDGGRVAFYAAEITVALQFLHSNGVIYRDLKMENVLLDRDGHCKLADFGLCKEGIIDDALTSTLCGTRYFWAPEMIESMSSQYGVSVDWWALGVMMYKMMKGHLPFKESNKAALFESIIRGDVYYPPWLGCDAISILKGLLTKNWAQRLGCSENVTQIRSHAFFKDLDWGALEQRRVKPPFRPKLKNPKDALNFNAKFTTKRPTLSLIPNDTIHCINQNKFSGFSFNLEDFNTK